MWLRDVANFCVVLGASAAVCIPSKFMVGGWEGGRGMEGRGGNGRGADVGLDGFTGLCAGTGAVSGDLGECMYFLSLW